MLPTGHTAMAKKRQDTTISLYPLSFEEAIKVLASPPKREDSQAEACDSTKEAVPESEPSKRRTSRRRKPSAG